MEYRDALESFKNGSVANFNRKQLEELLAAVTRERLLNADHEIKSSMMVACAQTLLSVRCSQELNNNTVTVARLSLFVSLAALIVSGGLVVMKAMGIIP